MDRKTENLQHQTNLRTSTPSGPEERARSQRIRNEMTGQEENAEAHDTSEKMKLKKSLMARFGPVVGLRSVRGKPRGLRLAGGSFHLPLTAFCLVWVVLSGFAKQDFGQFDNGADIGGPKIAGSAAYDAAQQEYTLTGAGTNMWFARDQFYFLWKRMKGDFILRARVEFAGKGAINHRKIGWMIRPSLDPEAAYVDCAEHGDGLTSLQFRRTPGANTEEFILPVTGAVTLQLERKGGACTFSAARPGEPFVSGTAPDFKFGDEVYAGLYICSHEGEVAEKAVFRDVRIILPVKQGFVPYRDYIGSVLEILDLQSGRLEKAYQSKQPFEAPNWTRDGAALIYNISGRGEGWGRLSRFDLATRAPSIINTGPARRNNNDHVLSFDGTMLAISDQSGGASRVYTVPTGGGAPRQITPDGPCYCHGWSPDGRFLLYTAGKSGKFDIYKRAFDGAGEEIRLTDAPGLNDGAEFTPDGKHVYFNSSRTGKMQIWRMSPDGTEQEQVTRDDYNNWFPHISPDGKWIAFVTFGPEMEPTDHPYYKQVYIRLMSIEGNAPKVIAYVYGGQGTMNVPSWSPDSRRLAFVSNSQ
jgi:TolB protein